MLDMALEEHNSDEVYFGKNVEHRKGEQIRPLKWSFCRALQYSFLSLLKTTTTPLQR